MSHSTTQSPTDSHIGPSTGQGAAGKSSGVVASVTSALSAAGTTVTSTLTSAYQQAPDLGLTSTAKAAANNISGTTGDGEQRQQQQQQSTAADTDGAAVYPNNQQAEEAHEDLDGPSTLRKRHEERVAQSKEVGPSSEGRIGKGQSEVGTEEGIPTAAGAGTTQSQDATVQKGLDKKTQPQQAHVPADFEQVDCPSQFAGGKAKEQTVAPHSSASSTSTTSAPPAGETTETSDAAINGKRSLGQKIKDGIKGEAKIVRGTIKRDQETVQEGKAIRKGQA